MVEKWIEEDKDFIQASLGPNARLVLKQQNKTYFQQTLNHRLEFLDKLFNSFRS